LRHQQTHREQRTLALTLRQSADRRVEERQQIEALDDFVAQVAAAVEEPHREIDGPPHRLRGPRHDRVREVEERAGALAVCERPAVAQQRAGVQRQDAAEALEQRGLAGAVRADQAEHLAWTDGERHIAQRRKPSVPLSEISGLKQGAFVTTGGGYYQGS